MILAGDVGGTKVNLGLFRLEGNRLSSVAERSYASREFPGLIPLLESFLKETRAEITQACLGVAGPVHEGTCRLTHLPWTVYLPDLKALLPTEAVYLINDLAALAHAVPHLPSGDLEILQTGKRDSRGAVAVLAAGTGLGQAFLIPEGEGRFRALETEGGQCDFAPRTEVEMDLHAAVRRQRGRVAIEDILSGPGLVRLYEFFRERCQEAEPPGWAEGRETKGRAEAVVRNGLTGQSIACREALETFVSVYGAVAGNLALQAVARGGVYLGGGIAPEISSLLKTGLFLDAFRDKGEFSGLMTEIPVQVILNKRAPLLGAAYFALGETRIQ